MGYHNLVIRFTLIASINNRSQLPMHNNIGVSPNRRREVRIDGHIEGIMDPLLLRHISNHKILSLLQNEDHLVVEDIFDALFNLGVLDDFVEFLLDLDVSGDFDWVVDLCGEFLESFDLLVAWELVFSQEGA